MARKVISKIKPISLGKSLTNQKNNKEVNSMNEKIKNQETPTTDTVVALDTVTENPVTDVMVEETVSEVKVEEATTETVEETSTVEEVSILPTNDEVPTEDVVETEAETTKQEVEAKGKKSKGKKNDEPKDFVRTTRLEKNNQTKTMKWLFRNRDKLKFDLAIQRKEVWSLEQKSNLIHSILYGYPIPPMMAMETDDDNIWFLDGKQRGTTIISFLANEWSLSKKTPPACGFDIAGKKFSELVSDMQDAIEEEPITLIKIKGITEEERDEMFVRWNSGTALSKIELTRAKHADLMEQVNDISELEFFAEDIAMTKTGRNRFQDQEIIMQIAMLLEKGRDGIKGFGSKDIDNYVMEKKENEEVLSDSLLVKINRTATYMNMVSSDLSLPQKKKILKKANTPVIFYIASELMNEQIKPSIYSEFLIKFLDEEYDKDSEYGQTLQSSVSKRDNVVTRISILQFAFNEFLEGISKTRDNKDIYKQVNE